MTNGKLYPGCVCMRFACGIVSRDTDCFGHLYGKIRSPRSIVKVIDEGFVFFHTDSTKQSVSRLLPGHRISFVVCYH